MKELLTSKCKENFEKWFIEKFNIKPDLEMFPTPSFYDMSFCFQYGVYLDFFDSVGLYINVLGYTTIWEWSIYTIPNTWWECKNTVITRQEAQEQAIIKANTIYNERH